MRSIQDVDAPLLSRWFLVLVAVPLLTACGGAAATQTLAAQYMAIAVAGNQHLDHDHDALAGQDRGQLRAAAADLTHAAATESRFDRELLALDLPPAIRVVANALVTANEARIALDTEAAQAATVDALHRLLARLPDADAAVEKHVRTIRMQLGLPPPDTS